MAPPTAAQLIKSQVQQIRDWRMKYGQSVPQNTVRNMSTKDNPGTLPINVYAQTQPASEPLDFSKITENGTPQTDTHHVNTHNLFRSTGDVVFLASRSCQGQYMRKKYLVLWWKPFAGDSNFELTENEFLRYQSRMIECVDAVTIEEAKKIRERQDIGQDS
ncbi:Hypothetical predicted protein [Paramuricea clavata]|uniref:Uncharacterized protein n=1 Tax=Paramuricea clavata TaxID=317549 RepID=A0A7D9I8B9_PARCT|nr:Hypothetical predicted protein [Paramuricea clavata]